MTNVKKTYHHGDLRRSLLDEAVVMIDETGFDAISMRKLADKVGVSRTALYHHFDGKPALLSALAEDGFVRFTAELQDNARLARREKGDSSVSALHNYVACYVDFAVENAAYYDLMFGREIWKTAQATESLKEVAYASFKTFVDTVVDWQQDGLLVDDVDALRYAQVAWASLHGLSRLLIDGIYIEQAARASMIETMALMISQCLARPE
ncbi:HTH-type transcriptional regulator BetI [Sinobacterium norvegicum]|uniref:HTH-type transcriptional regulator BetI n=1 Tax=Sinobacterium norvegicum TaxID=1641715 RepID=A0ABM9ACE9_9GAMM|nr:TetR/AcrR family transcriptional regulator [Sinobacterium norvegicum]CAH0990872.1 HTH-type transcriptional regulator BetI [Sinobacterium norvegicum]